MIFKWNPITTIIPKSSPNLFWLASTILPAGGKQSLTSGTATPAHYPQNAVLTGAQIFQKECPFWVNITAKKHSTWKLTLPPATEWTFFLSYGTTMKKIRHANPTAIAWIMFSTSLLPRPMLRSSTFSSNSAIILPLKSPPTNNGKSAWTRGLATSHTPPT